MYGLWILSILKKPFWMVFFIGVFFLRLYREGLKKSCLVWVILSLVFILHHQSDVLNLRKYHRVHQIYSHKIVFQNSLNRYDYYGDTTFEMGDKIMVDGFHNFGVLDNLRIRGEITDKDIVSIHKGQSLKSIFWKHISKKDELVDFFLRQTDSIFSILSLQLWGFLNVFEYFYRKFFIDKYLRVLKGLLCILYGYLFGVNFGVVRIFLQLIFRDRVIVISLLLLMFPHAAYDAGFYLVYLPYLMQHLSLGFHNLEPSIFRRFLLLRCLGRLHLLEMIFFKYLSWVAGFIVWMSITGLDSIAKVLLISITQGLNNPRFLLVGLPSLIWGIGFICFTKRKQQLIFWFMVLFGMYYPLFRVSMVQVYQGDATLITFPFNVYTVLIDTGKPSAFQNLKRTLYSHGVKKINTLIITHPDLDHDGNKDTIIELFGVDKVIETKDASHPFFKILLDDVYYDDVNENSLILYFDVYETKFLIMGDAGVEQEKEIVKRYPHFEVDVLKLGHHGSLTSSSESFLKALKPQIGLISSDPRIYNHPHPEVRRRLYNLRIIPMETSVEGTVTFKMLPFLKIVVSEAKAFGIMK